MMPWICAVLPCSAALARQNPSSSYSTCRFLRALGGVGVEGVQQQHGGSQWKGDDTHTEALSSPILRTHNRLSTHTEACISTMHLQILHRSSDSWASACTHTRKHNQLKRVAHPFMTNHFHLQLLNSSPPPLLLKYAVQPKYFPCRSCWIQYPAKATSVCRKNYSKFKARPG